MSLLDTATWPRQVKECKIISEPSLLTGWLAGYVCCQPHFQFHEERIVNEAVRQPSPSRSAKAMESGEVDGCYTSVLRPVNAGVYGKQYEN